MSSTTLKGVLEVPYRIDNPNNPKGGRQMVCLTHGEIENAIRICHSMKSSAQYLGVSYNIFKREALKHNLWNPTPVGGKGKKRVTMSGRLSSEFLFKILRGEHPNNYHDSLVLARAITEKFILPECSNCGNNYEHIKPPNQPPLVLDYLDRNTKNGSQDNLRALCLSCVYELRQSKQGWYRHRDVPIHRALRELPDKIEVKEDDFEYIPFEEFQKSLEN